MPEPFEANLLGQPFDQLSILADDADVGGVGELVSRERRTAHQSIMSGRAIGAIETKAKATKGTETIEPIHETRNHDKFPGPTAGEFLGHKISVRPRRSAVRDLFPVIVLHAHQTWVPCSSFCEMQTSVTLSIGAPKYSMICSRM